jgi:lipoprotein-anchoring transpeptidase ErfK/SrfK
MASNTAERDRQGVLRTSWLPTVLASILAVVVTATAASAVGERTGWAEARRAAATPTAISTAPGTSTGPAATVPEVGSGALVREALRRRPVLRNARERAPRPNLLVNVPRDLLVRARPDAAAPVIGVVPDGSKYYGVATVAWVERVSSNGRWGRVQIPYVSPRRSGWISIQGLERRTTWVSVRVDVSRRRIMVFRRDVELIGAPAAVGAPSSPTPPGRYFVTDRVPFYAGHYLGSFAFGISGIQPNLPAGWSGGNQLAIHGTSNPSSIGQAVSAGCVRVAEATLAKLKSLLALGTPVIVVP